MKHETEFSADVYISTHTDTDELRVLWVGVLTRAVLDLDPTKKGKEAARARDDAHRWFERGEDFDLVCHFAGFDPDSVRDAYHAGAINPELALYHSSAKGAENKGKQV